MTFDPTVLNWSPVPVSAPAERTGFALMDGVGGGAAAGDVDGGKLDLKDITC